MNRKLFKIQAFSILVIGVILLGIIPQAVMAAESLQYAEEELIPAPFEGYDLDSIYIFYDSSNEIMSAIAEGLNEIASFRINQVTMIPVVSYSDLMYWLLDEPWIAVYALQSNLKGVRFPDQELSWHQFYQILSGHRSTQHVVGMGNTLSFDHYIKASDDMIYHSEEEQADGLILLLYDLWAIREIALTRSHIDDDYRGAAEDLEKMVLQIWGDNFNEFFKRTVEPINPVGEIDAKKAEERRAAMWERHQPEREDAAYCMNAEGNLIEQPLNDLPDDFSPVINLVTASEVSSTNFIIGELPENSGLRGPIGAIADVLLLVLKSAGETLLVVPKDTMNSLRDIFESLQSYIGIVKDFDLESPLKSIIEGIVQEFPFPADLKSYLTPILKALFNLRGDIESIIEVVQELLTGLLPAAIPEEVMEFLNTILNLGSDLWAVVEDVVDEGKSVFDEILSFLTNNVVTAFLNKTLVAILDFAQGTINDLRSRGEAMLEGIVRYLSSLNFLEFIEDIGKDLLQTALDLIDELKNDLLEKIMSVIEIGFSLTELIDQFDASTMIELVSDLIEDFAGMDLLGDAEALARSLMEVAKAYSEVGLTSITQFQNELNTILSEEGGVPQATRELIVDIVTMIAGFFNDGFDDSQIPDMFDIIEDILVQFGSAAEGKTLAQTTDLSTAVESALKRIVGIIASIDDNDDLRRLVSRTTSNFDSELGSLSDMISDSILYLDLEGVLDGATSLSSALASFGNIVEGILSIVGSVRGQSFEGIMNTLLVAVSSVIGIFPSFDDVSLDAFLELLQYFFPEAFGLDYDLLPTANQVIDLIVELAGPLLEGLFDIPMLEDFLGFLMDIEGIFTDGVKWLLGKAYDWLTGELGILLAELEQMIQEVLSKSDDLFGHKGKLPIGLGEWSLFELTYNLGIRAEFNLNPTPLFEMVRSMIFEGRAVFSVDTLEDVFTTIFSFFEISPQFYAELGVEGFDSAKNPFLGFLLTFLGVDFSFSGSAKFVLNLFTFREGQFEWEDFFKIVEWEMNVRIALTRTLTLLDFLTGGVGGGVLNKLMEFIGLDSISVDIWFAIELNIVKKAATALAPETSSLTLILELGAALNIAIDLLIVGIGFRGSLEIILSFFQDLAGDTPMKILLRLVFTITLKLEFLWWDWKKSWSWEPGGPWDLSPKQGEDEYEESGVGFDSDKDGLSDDYESTIPGLDPNKADTDDDGANDKLEVQTMGSDPTNPDSDDDQLLDGEEYNLGTNPMTWDSDWDDISDYDEVNLYGTDPLTQDTDGDGLTDAYEIRTAWDITKVTPTVVEVVIGATSYNDHTDPLNADTDGDGIVDGDEGPMGAYYGLASLYNDTEEGEEGSGDWVMDPNPLIFNNGYTHPLDADTDDDSALQLYNGVVDSQAYLFLKDMNDGAEIAGFWIIKYDEEGEPEDVQVFTNPVNPDTDGDTGITDRTPQPGMWLNSDGYELAQTPPTDPTDGDSDDDGLLDGLEGVLNPYSNHTNPNDADTDDDGLFDMQEILLGCDPRSIDTDLDMIPDGDEFYIFFTSPYVADTDFDGLSDGEEVYHWHSNPLIDDSDGDKLLDGDEVLLYDSDPMDEDTDNDGLTDFEEIHVYYTNAFEYDTDLDGLSDGEEILYYDTDPLNWDTDKDSIKEPNEAGEMTWPMSDYDEVKVYGTNATEPDSDLDGLSDSIELYLGSGLIPWMDPIPIDPMNNDTDNDWIADGSELHLENVSDIVYPYVAVTIVFKYNTSPVVQDSDNDTLIDFQEVMVFNTDPASNDTDNDTISDWWEVWVYNTSALTNDTDGDSLLDNEETLTEVWPYGAWPPVNWSIGWVGEWNLTEGETLSSANVLADGWSLPNKAIPSAIYPTSATNPDSDSDWLPDGSEIFFYDTNPMDDNSDNDILLDTYEFDTDYDHLEDGMEFKLGLQMVPGGGILNPDSDHDGLIDGDEYYLYGTNPGRYDTDGDGYGDGVEILIGTNPNNSTTPEEFNESAGMLTGLGLHILTPINGSNAYLNTQIQVANLTSFNEVLWIDRHESGNTTAPAALEYNPSTRQWRSTGLEWVPGFHTLRVYGINTTGYYHAAQVSFIVIGENEPFPWWLVGVAAAAVFGVTVIGVFGYKKIKKRKASEPTKKTKRKRKAKDPVVDQEERSTKKKATKRKSTKKKSSSKKKGGGM
jgi:hypothetical protein